MVRRWRLPGLALALVLLILLLAADLAAAQPVPQGAAKSQPLAPLAWCRQDGQQANLQDSDQALLTQDPSRACDYRPVSAQPLPRGFSRDRHWLQLRLHNPDPQPRQAWLEVGHPRLQHVHLYQRQGQVWRLTRSGQAVPPAERPLRAQHLLLPIQLEAGASQDIYLMVAAATNLNLDLRLWHLPDYFAQQARTQFLQALGMGGLMLAAGFSLLILLRQRQRALLWLLASLVSEILLDASYTGLLAAYFWPAELPYEIRLHGLLVGLTLAFLILFVRDFLDSRRHYPGVDRLLRVCLWLIGLALLAGLQWGYAQPIRLLTLLAIVSMGLSLWLFFSAWRSGSGPAGYLLFSYLLLLVMIIYRASSAFGWVGGLPLQSFGFSWYFLLITPTILLGVLQRSEQLREAVIRAESDRQAHEQFLARMSHELRSPLSGLINQAQLLRQQAAGDSELQARAQAMLASGRRLLGLIDDILDYARLGAGLIRINPEPLPLGPFLRQLLEEHGAAAQRAGNRLRLQVEEPLPAQVLADEGRLRQVLDNLLSNANRYCRNGQVSLSCSAEVLDQDQVMLHCCVSDSGPGIPATEQARIFRPFQRGQAALGAADGLGIGLSVVRQLLQAMGGELRLHSAPGQGSEFCFSLRLGLLQGEPEPPRWLRADRPCRLLLVDDDADGRASLAQLLRRLGLEVLEAGSAWEARALLATPLDLVITDQFMADGDGWQLLREWSARCPLILLSAAPAQRPTQMPAEIDFARVYLKPLQLERLQADLASLLGIHWRDVPPQALAHGAAPEAAGAGRPDPAQCRELAGLLDAGAISDILDWQARLAQQQPALAGYCQAVRQASLALDFARLRQLANPEQ